MSLNVESILSRRRCPHGNDPEECRTCWANDEGYYAPVVTAPVVPAESKPVPDTSDTSGRSDSPDTSDAGIQGPPPRLLDGLRNGSWLDAQTFPDLGWFVPRIIPEGATELVGAPKIGKSWLALDVGLAVACGGCALGSIAVGQPRPVLHLALEDGDRRLQARARRLLGGAPIPPSWSYLTRIEPNMCEATITAWLETLPAAADPLVILDVVGKVMPPSRPGEGAYARDYRAVGGLKAICDVRPGMGLVLLNHNRKANSDDFVETSSGTNGIAGAVDSVVVIARARTETTALLKVTGRDVEEAEYAVTMSDGLWRLDGETPQEARRRAVTERATRGLDERSQSIVTLLGEHPEGLSPSEIGAALDIGPKDVGAYLKRLLEAGRIDKPARGLYIPLSEPSDLSERRGTS